MSVYFALIGTVALASVAGFFFGVLNWALAIIAISMLILVHELGHFMMAKAVGMRVETFSIGFWKKIVGFRRGETEYRLSVIPLGGYVKVAGESPEEGGGAPDEFWSKTPGQRALFVVGGVTMNFLLAFVLFAVAFAIGVRTGVAEVGLVETGSAAWEAGLRPGDRIVSVDGRPNPVFEDLLRSVMLGEVNEPVHLGIEREGERLDFSIVPRYRERAGTRAIGIAPPVEPVITRLIRQEYSDVCPAEKAGLRVGDRIVAIDGEPVETWLDFDSRLIDHGEGPVRITVLRDGVARDFDVHAQRRLYSYAGISGVSATVESLQADGVAETMGIRVGDRITAVDDVPVASQEEMTRALSARLGEPVEIAVERDGETLAFTDTFPRSSDVYRLVASMLCKESTVLAWVEEGAPAWEAGMRAGDEITAVGGQPVATWTGVFEAGRSSGSEPRTYSWVRDGKEFHASMALLPGTADEPVFIGVRFDRIRMTVVREGPLGAIARGMRRMVMVLAETGRTVRGFGSGAISPKNLGGIVTIGRASYLAAEEGIGKLLYITAIISASIALLNILPIPVLDGGHLLFIAIEKVRGRRLGERAMIVAQSIGFTLLIALVVYATYNDITRVLGF